MSETISGPVWPDWQDDHAYAYSQHLTSRGWAWEFLRRNPGFQNDLRAVLQRVDLSRSGTADIIRMAAAEPDLLFWGILFCKLAQEFRERLLVPPPMFARPCGFRRTSIGIARS